jgi:hypothetical protein
MKFHVVWTTRERLATDMLQDANDPAWLHALPALFHFFPRFSFHCRPGRKLFVPPRLSP